MVTSSTNGVNIDELLVDDASVFPNPVIDYFNGDIKNSDITEIEIYQVDGSLLLNKKISTQTTLVDLSTLQSGVYIYKLLDINHSIISVNKVIINK